MARTSLAASLILLVAGLAGCAGGAGDGGYDVEVHSGQDHESGIVEVRSDEAPPTVAASKGEGRGHLAGVVVDQAIRPIKGALVRLTGLDLKTATDRDGSFGFVDLPPGPHFLEAKADGYLPAQAAVAVVEGDFTRVKVVLTAIPPAEPYRVMQEFAGFVDVSSTPYAGGTFVCEHCDFPFQVASEGLESLVVEAAFDAPDAGNARSFMAWLQGSRVGGTWLCIVCSAQADPVRIELRGDELANRTEFNLHAEPQTSPLPETSVRFHAYATAFYHRAPPAGWSFVAGDP